jgi:DNA repair protein RecO (recombination protein O)
MSIHKTEAIVLSRRNFRETSIIANFYTTELGKMSGLLKGIRTDPSKFASTVEPFSHNEIIFYKKRNSALHLVSQCDLKENFNSLRQDIAKIGVASILMELVDAVSAPEDKNEDIFNLVLNTLSELAANNNPQKIMAIFKIKTLDFAGFRPHLDSCVCCGDKILGESKFSLALGGLLCSRCKNKDFSARSIFRGTVATILHIEKNDFKNNLNLGMNPQIKKELELILNSFLNFHLGRDLKSEKVLNELMAVA